MRLRTFNQCKQIFPFFPFRWLDLFFVYHSSKHLKQETKKRMQMIKKNILKRRKRNKKGEIDNRLFYFLLLFPPSAPKLPQWGVVVSVANLSGTKWSPHVILFFLLLSTFPFFGQFRLLDVRGHENEISGLVNCCCCSEECENTNT